MLLREIGLSAPRPLQPDEAKVENMSRVVCALIIKAMAKKVKTPNFWKISIRINDEDHSDNGRVLLGVLVIKRSFPVIDFLNQSRSQRQSRMLKFISGALGDVFVERNIDKAIVDRAAKQVIASRFCNKIVGKEESRSPFGAETAAMECEQGFEEANVSLVVRSKLGTRKIPIATTDPDEFIIQRYMGRVEWLDRTRLVLHLVDGAAVPVDVS